MPHIKNISLLYPDEKLRDEKYMLSDFSFVEGLNLYSIFSINPNKFDLKPYFTKSKEVILYRQKVFNDLQKCETDDIETLLTIIEDVSNLRILQSEAEDILSSVYTISEIELYISLIEFLYNFFNKYSFDSEGLISLKESVDKIKNSEDFKYLSENLIKVRSTLNNIKSMTIGVNLDTNLRPIEAGVVSINENSFRSGNILDRILSADIKNDGFRCLTPLTPIKKALPPERKRLIDMAFYFAIEDLIKKSLKDWKPFIRKYVFDNSSDFFNVIGDFHFYLYFIRYFNECKSKKLNLCFPDISDDDVCYKDLYNVKLSEKVKSNEIVHSDLTFDENGKIYILTGPNQGGKSIFLRAVGINQALFQLGLMVHAKHARLKISNNILTYFTKHTGDNIGFGHLGEECNAISNLLKHASTNTMILFDEPFSSTSLKDGLYILGEVVAALLDIDAYGIVITHIHETFDYLKSRSDIKTAKIDSLLALMRDTASGQRSYEVKREVPKGESYAIDIAKKYGIERKNIVEKALV